MLLMYTHASIETNEQWLCGSEIWGEEPVSTVVLLVIIRQISATLLNDLKQSEFWIGISVGLKDTKASTITIGCDL